MTPPVLLPALLVRFGAERLFLAVADGLYVVGGNPSLNQRVTNRVRTAVAQGQVVFRRSPFVAVSFHRKADVGMLLQELDVALHRGLLVRADIALVIFEVDVLHGL